jgi:hypothetical protein
MSYENSHRKTVLILNTEFPIAILMNAVGHSILGLIAKTQITEWNMLDYPSTAFLIESQISEYPVVVLRAKKSTQLEKLIVQVNEAKIISNVFIDAMIGRNAVDQQQATREAIPVRNRIICVALFGEEINLRPLIKSYSVYKTSDVTANSLPAATETGIE